MSQMKSRASERIEHLGSNPNDPMFFDLSTSGACCHCKKQFERGTVVTVRLNDTNLKAKVIHCTERTDGFRIGVQFVEVGQQERKFLEEIVGKYSRGVPVSCGIVE